MRRAFLVATLVAATTGVHAGEGPRRLTVDEAIRIAASHNARLRAARSAGAAASAQSDSVRGRLGPSVHLDEEWQYYSQPFRIAFGPMAFQVRDQSVNTFVASVGQPVLGLLHIGEDWAASKDAADASDDDVRTGEAAMREVVRQGFINYFEARAEVDIARASQTQLDEQVKVAQAKLQAGVLTKADVLRVEVALANAKQQEIQAESRSEVALATLVDALGLDGSDERYELVEPTELLAAAERPLPSLGDAAGAATSKRPELQAASARMSAAAKHSSAQAFALLPEVNLEGAYVRIDGQAFAPKESYFVGVKASWAPWEWGASYYQRQAAARQADAAAANLDEQKHQVTLDLATRMTQARAADAAMQVAKAAIESAEEAYRVTSVSVQAGAATTTDLLDAQSALTQARLNVTRARYGQAASRVALARAMGE